VKTAAVQRGEPGAVDDHRIDGDGSNRLLETPAPCLAIIPRRCDEKRMLQQAAIDF
jgi:hypothetical protein